MRILLYLAGIFIDTFGITHPSEEERYRAAQYIAFLLFLLVALLCSAVVLAAYVLQHSTL